MSRAFWVIAGILGAAGVMLGAFGAHALRDRLSADMLTVWQTAVQYHLWHALALLAAGFLVGHYPGSGWLTAAGWCFVAGVLVFSGSLYLLALTGVRTLGAVTPVGGLLLILGWLLLAWGVFRSA